MAWGYEDPIGPLWEALSAEAAEVERAKQALEMVVSWAAANEHAFHSRERRDQNDAPVPPPDGFAGRWDEDCAQGDGGWSFVAFYPHALKKLLRDHGHDPDPILRTWRDRGWLETFEDRKGPSRAITEAPPAPGPRPQARRAP